MNGPQSMVNNARKLTAQANTAINNGLYEDAADLLYEAGGLLVSAGRAWRESRYFNRSKTAAHRAYMAENESGDLFLQAQRLRERASGGHG